MLDPSLHYIVVRRCPERLAERTRKMMNRQLCNFGEHFQGDIFLPSDCICFPTDQPPFFGFPIEQEIAAKVKCPLHGIRFRPEFHIYVPKWCREKEKKVRWFRLSEQYHKAWNAGFPLDLWPAEEEESEDRTVFLKLKDGTRLLAYEPAYSRPSTGKIVPVNIVAGRPKQSE